MLGRTKYAKTAAAAIIPQNNNSLITLNANKTILITKAKTIKKIKNFRYLLFIKPNNPLLHSHKDKAVFRFNLLVSVYVALYCNKILRLLIRK